MATVTISTKIAGGHRNNLWYEVQMCILTHPIHPTAQLPGFHEEQLGDSATTPNEIPRYRRSTPLIDAGRHLPPLPPRCFSGWSSDHRLAVPQTLAAFGVHAGTGIYEYVREQHPYKELIAA